MALRVTLEEQRAYIASLEKLVEKLSCLPGLELGLGNYKRLLRKARQELREMEAEQDGTE